VEGKSVMGIVPFLHIANPTQIQKEKIEKRTIQKGRIKSYAKSGEEGIIELKQLNGTTLADIVFWTEHLFNPFDVEDFKVGTYVLIATAIPDENGPEEQERALVVNIEKDPEFFVMKSAHLLSHSAASSLFYEPEVCPDFFIGEDLGGKANSPYLDFPISMYCDTPRNPVGAISLYKRKARKYYLRSARATEGELSKAFRRKARRMNGPLRILVNTPNFGYRTCAYWLAAGIAHGSEQGGDRDRVFFVRIVDPESTRRNLTSINDFSQYYDPRSQHCYVSKIHFSPLDMQFRRFDKRAGKVVDGRSDSQAKFCLIELSKCPSLKIGEVSILELKVRPEDYSVAPLPEDNDSDYDSEATDGAGEEDWHNSLLVAHYDNQREPLPRLNKSFITRKPDPSCRRLISRYLRDLSKDEVKEKIRALSGPGVGGAMTHKAPEWFSPTKPWVAIVHMRPDTIFATTIKQKVICRNDAEMLPLAGSQKVVRLFCENEEEQKFVIKNLSVVNGIAQAEGTPKPFEAYFAKYNEMRFLRNPDRLPEQQGVESRGAGFVFIQGIPAHLPDAHKEAALRELGIPAPREVEGTFIRCKGQECPVIRIFVEDVKEFYERGPIIYNQITKSFEPKKADSFQGKLIGPTEVPEGDIVEVRPLFTRTGAETGQKNEQEVEEEVDPAQWAAANKYEAKLLAALGKMPGPPGTGVERVATEGDQQRETKDEGKAEKAESHSPSTPASKKRMAENSASKNNPSSNPPVNQTKTTTLPSYFSPANKQPSSSSSNSTVSTPSQSSSQHLESLRREKESKNNPASHSAGPSFHSTRSDSHSNMQGNNGKGSNNNTRGNYNNRSSIKDTSFNGRGRGGRGGGRNMTAKEKFNPKVAANRGRVECTKAGPSHNIPKAPLFMASGDMGEGTETGDGSGVEIIENPPRGGERTGRSGDGPSQVAKRVTRSSNKKGSKRKGGTESDEEGEEEEDSSNNNKGAEEESKRSSRERNSRGRGLGDRNNDREEWGGDDGNYY
jgi:hypothetical protein